MKAKIARAAAALLWAALVLPAAADLSGPRKGYDPTNNTFVDVKSEPLATSDVFTTTWVFHASSLAAGPNYAGVLFTLIYDGHELSDLKLTPVNPHVALGGFSVVTLPGSGTSPTIARLTAWIDPARIAASGITVNRSEVLPIFRLSGHAKATTLDNNSDIDITVDPWIIRHIPDTMTINLQKSDFLYLTADGLPAPVGQGTWVHVTDTQVFTLPGSALYAVAGVNAAGFGIEHVPEPAALALLALGAGALAIGRWRQRRA